METEKKYLLEIITKLLDDPAFKSKVKYYTKKYLTNDKILEKGKQREYIYLIKMGKVRISISSPKIEEKNVHPGVNELGPGDTFGEFGMFEDYPKASADVIAVTDCELVEIDIATLKNYLSTNTEIGYKVLYEILRMLVKQKFHSDQTILSLYSWGMKAHKLDQYLDDEKGENKS